MVVTRMDTPKSGIRSETGTEYYFIIIFRQIAPTLYDLVVFKEISIQRLKKAKMRMVTPKYGSKPTWRLVVFHVLFVRIKCKEQTMSV